MEAMTTSSRWRLLMVGAAAASGALAAPIWELREQIAPALGTANYDLCIANGRHHIVYETGGNLYYAMRTFGGTSWTVMNLGSGSGPSVAHDGTGAYVTFIRSGSLHITDSANFSIQTLLLANTQVAVIDIAGGVKYIVTEGNYDGDGHVDIGKMTDSGGGWSGNTILYDGDFHAGSGTYFGQISVSARPDGIYSCGVEQRNWGGRAAWSDKDARVGGTGATGYWGGYSWEIAVELSRQAVDTSGSMAGLAYSVGGSLYYRHYDGSAWSGDSVGPGIQGTVDLSAGSPLVIFQNAGALYVYDGATTTNLEYQDANQNGTSPILDGTTAGQAVLFRDSGNNLILMSTIPEPMTLGLPGASVWLVAWVRRRHPPEI